MCLIQILGIIRQLDKGSAFPSMHCRTWTNGVMSSWFTGYLLYQPVWKIKMLLTVGLESLCSVKCLKAVRHNDLTPNCHLCPTRSSSKPEPVCWWGLGGHCAAEQRGRSQWPQRANVNVGSQKRADWSGCSAEWFNPRYLPGYWIFQVPRPSDLWLPALPFFCYSYSQPTSRLLHIILIASFLLEMQLAF